MPANHLYAILECPKCGSIREAEIEVEIDGRGFAQDYKVGDRVGWLSDSRPSNGGLIADGYVVCNNCGRDYFVEVLVENEVIQHPVVNTSKGGYID